MFIKNSKHTQNHFFNPAVTMASRSTLPKPKYTQVISKEKRDLSINMNNNTLIQVQYLVYLELTITETGTSANTSKL